MKDEKGGRGCWTEGKATEAAAGWYEEWGEGTERLTEERGKTVDCGIFQMLLRQSRRPYVSVY